MRSYAGTSFRLEFLPRERSRTFRKVRRAQLRARARTQAHALSEPAAVAFYTRALQFYIAAAVTSSTKWVCIEKEIVSRERSREGMVGTPRRLSLDGRTYVRLARGHRFGQGRSLRAFNVLFARSLSPVCTRCPEPIARVLSPPLQKGGRRECRRAVRRYN